MPSGYGRSYGNYYTDDPAAGGGGGAANKSSIPGWVPWAIVGAETAGGLLGGINQGKANKAELGERKREFDISQAGAPTRALESLPLRDRLLHILLSRFGNHPTTYADAQASYTPGAGGTEQSKAIYEETLRRMGYGAQLQPSMAQRMGRQPFSHYTGPGDFMNKNPFSIGPDWTKR